MNYNYDRSANRLRHQLPLFFIIAVIFISTMMVHNAKGSALVDDFFKVHGFTSDKVAQLAEAIPAEKYDWRPGEGVRSVKECILHLTSANYYMASLLGTPIPEGIDTRDLEKSDITKEETISAYKKSVEHIQNAIKNLKSADFDTEVEFFGMKGTKRQVIFIAGDHVAEHLGQLIAYARVNGIVPPWSQKSK